MGAQEADMSIKPTYDQLIDEGVLVFENVGEEVFARNREIWRVASGGIDRMTLDGFIDSCVRLLPPGRAEKFLNIFGSVLPLDAEKHAEAFWVEHKQICKDQFDLRETMMLLVSTGGMRTYAEQNELGNTVVKREKFKGVAYYATPEGHLLSMPVEGDDICIEDWRPLKKATLDDLIEAIRSGYALEEHGLAVMHFAVQQPDEIANLLLRAWVSRADITDDMSDGPQPGVDDIYWEFGEGNERLKTVASRLASQHSRLARLSSIAGKPQAVM